MAVYLALQPSRSLNDFFPFQGKISSWIDLDSEDEVLRQDSETALRQEIAWASHLSLQVFDNQIVTSSEIKSSSGDFFLG